MNVRVPHLMHLNSCFVISQVELLKFLPQIGKIDGELVTPGEREAAKA